MNAEPTPVGELCTCGGFIAWQERDGGWEGTCLGDCGQYVSVNRDDFEQTIGKASM